MSSQSCWKSYFVNASPASFCECLILHSRWKTQRSILNVCGGCIYKLNAACVDIQTGLMKWLLKLTISTTAVLSSPASLGMQQCPVQQYLPRSVFKLTRQGGRGAVLSLFPVSEPRAASHEAKLELKLMSPTSLARSLILYYHPNQNSKNLNPLLTGRKAHCVTQLYQLWWGVWCFQGKQKETQNRIAA